MMPSATSAVSVFTPHCVQQRCNFTCSNGKASDIEATISAVSRQNVTLRKKLLKLWQMDIKAVTFFQNHYCNSIHQLTMINYEFSDNVLTYGFLGNYSDKVESLNIICSNIVNIAADAFAKGRFKRIYLENLQLKELRKDFFRGITSDFISLTIKQFPTPVHSIHSDFLWHVKFQLKYLTIAAGLKSVSNLTAGDFLLHNLTHVQFGDNDFGHQMLPTAFSRVAMMEVLDLKHSNLQYLPANIFAHVVSKLRYLNLSDNKLKTISFNIFGNAKTSHALRLYAEGNKWWCSCELQRDMNLMISHSQSLFCSQPESYKGWSVFDIKICGQINQTTTTVGDMEETIAYAQATRTTVMQSPHAESSSNLMRLVCHASPSNKNDQRIHPTQWPFIVFTVICQEDLAVNVIVSWSSQSPESFSLIWFSKVSTEHYEMPINYEDYGLGCYTSVGTTVKHLTPNTAYTFCVVLKQQIVVSPFNCKSTYVGSNQTETASVWLTGDLRMAALTFVIFGTSTFFLLGIFVFLFLVKCHVICPNRGDRIDTVHSSSAYKVLSSKCKNSACNCDSETSSSTYMTTNLYEDITAYRELNALRSFSIPSKRKEQHNVDEIQQQKTEESFYLTPLQIVTESSLQHSEIL